MRREKGWGIRGVGLREGDPASWEPQVLPAPLACQQALPRSDHSFTICKMRKMAHMHDFSVFSLLSIVKTLFKRNLTLEADVKNKACFSPEGGRRGRFGSTAPGGIGGAQCRHGFRALGLGEGEAMGWSQVKRGFTGCAQEHFGL